MNETLILSKPLFQKISNTHVKPPFLYGIKMHFRISLNVSHLLKSYRCDRFLDEKKEKEKKGKQKKPEQTNK